MGKDTFTGEDPAGPVSLSGRVPDASRVFTDGTFFSRVLPRTFLVVVDCFAAGFLFSVDMTSFPSAGWLYRKLPPEDVYVSGGDVHACI
ncbi:MAG: hypothetical protein WB853_14245 [Desulfobacterales bacterium]